MLFALKPLQSVFLFIGVLALGVTGCATMSEAKAPTKSKVPAVATVDGAPITRLELEQFERMKPRSAAQGKANALQALINTRILAQEARRQGLDKKPEVQAAIRVATDDVLAKALLEGYLRSHPVKEEDIKARYGKMVEAMPKEQYHVRVALFDDKQSAKKAANAAKRGKSFEDIAKGSSDKRLAARGGDMGWIVLNRLPKPLAEALSGKKPGSVVGPIKVNGQWAVVKLEGKRATKAPALEQVKERIRLQLQEALASRYVAELREKAKVRIIEQK